MCWAHFLCAGCIISCCPNPKKQYPLGWHLLCTAWTEAPTYGRCGSACIEVLHRCSTFTIEHSGLDFSLFKRSGIFSASFVLSENLLCCETVCPLRLWTLRHISKCGKNSAPPYNGEWLKLLSRGGCSFLPTLLNSECAWPHRPSCCSLLCQHCRVAFWSCVNENECSPSAGRWNMPFIDSLSFKIFTP